MSRNPRARSNSAGGGSTNPRARGKDSTVASVAEVAAAFDEMGVSYTVEPKPGGNSGSKPKDSNSNKPEGNNSNKPKGSSASDSEVAASRNNYAAANGGVNVGDHYVYRGEAPSDNKPVASPAPPWTTTDRFDPMKYLKPVSTQNNTSAVGRKDASVTGGFNFPYAVKPFSIRDFTDTERAVNDALDFVESGKNIDTLPSVERARLTHGLELARTIYDGINDVDKLFSNGGIGKLSDAQLNKHLATAVAKAGDKTDYVSQSINSYLAEKLTDEQSRRKAEEKSETIQNVVTHMEDRDIYEMRRESFPELPEYGSREHYEYIEAEYNVLREKDRNLPAFGSFEYFADYARSMVPSVEAVMNDPVWRDSTEARKLADEYSKNQNFTADRDTLESAKLYNNRLEAHRKTVGRYVDVLSAMQAAGRDGVHTGSGGGLSISTGVHQAETEKELWSVAERALSPDAVRSYRDYSTAYQTADIAGDVIKAYRYAEVFGNKKYKNNPLGVIAGNFRLGDIGLSEGDAGTTISRYESDDTEAADIYDYVRSQIVSRSGSTFASGGALKDSLANIVQFVPQGIRQASTYYLGYAMGAAVTGKSRTGQVVGNLFSAFDMYNQTAGQSYLESLRRGLDPHDARALASSNATISGVIEFGVGAVADLVAGPVAGKIFKTVVNGAKPGVLVNLLTKAGVSTKGANRVVKLGYEFARNTIEGLGGGTEEALQEAVGITAEKFASRGEVPSTLELLVSACDFTSYSEEDFGRMADSFKAGFVIESFTSLTRGAWDNVTGRSKIEAAQRAIKNTDAEYFGSVIRKLEASQLVMDNVVVMGEESSNKKVRSLAGSLSDAVKNDTVTDADVGKAAKSLLLEGKNVFDVRAAIDRATANTPDAYDSLSEVVRRSDGVEMIKPVVVRREGAPSAPRDAFDEILEMGKGSVSAGNATAKQAGKLPKNLLLEGENVFGSSVSAVGNVETMRGDDVYYQVENEGVAEGEPAFYSVASDDAVNKSIKQQIREKMGEIMLSPAVANVEYDDETVKTVRNMRNDVIHLLDERGRSTDSEVVREGFGAIDMSYQRLKNGLKYMNSALEIYSLPYVADVVKNGKQIYYESKHKATGNESFTFAAPININGVTYAMGVVVQRSGATGGNKYHVHRVILPDGSSLVFDNKKKQRLLLGSVSQESEKPVSPITAVSNTIISQDSEEYNGKNKKVNHGLTAADIENGNIPEGLRARLERYRNVMSRLGYNVIFAPNREVSPDVIGYADVVNKEVYLAPAHLSESLMMHELVHVIQKGFGGKYIKSLVSFVKQEFSSLWDEAAESATAKYANVSGANIEAEALAEVCVQLCDDKYIDFAVDMNPSKIKQISLMLRYMGAKIASVFGKNEVSHKLKLASLKWQLALYESARIADDAGSSSSPVQRGGSVSGVGDDGVYLAVDDAGGGTHIDSRTVAGVGSRRVNAFQYNNPQVHPYYREIAEELLRDIGNTQRGVKYPTEGQQRRRRVTSESIARIKDGFGATYDEITHALKCIINDKGQENFALAKRIELVMDDMLSNGYVNLAGETIQANGEYIELKNSLKDEGDSVNRDAASRGIPSRQSVDRSAAATDDAGVSDRGAEGRRDTQDAPKRSNRGIDALRYYQKDADELLEELDSINFLIDSGELDPDTKLAALTKKHMIEKALSGKSKYVEDMLGRKMEQAKRDTDRKIEAVEAELFELLAERDGMSESATAVRDINERLDTLFRRFEELTELKKGEKLDRDKVNALYKKLQEMGRRPGLSKEEKSRIDHWYELIRKRLAKLAEEHVDVKDEIKRAQKEVEDLIEKRKTIPVNETAANELDALIDAKYADLRTLIASGELLTVIPVDENVRKRQDELKAELDALFEERRNLSSNEGNAAELDAAIAEKLSQVRKLSAEVSQSGVGAETESDVVVPELTGRAKRISDTVEAYRRTGDARLINELPSKKSLRSSERFRQGKVVQINRELDALYREYRDPETSATQKEEITAQINEALSALREIRRNNEVYKKVAELQDEVSTAARPNHSWLNQVVESVQDAEGNVVKEVTVANELRDRDNMLTEGKYGFNDVDRNFRHFFGKYYKEAYDAILKPLWRSTKRYAEGVNSYRERLLKDVVRGLGIKKGSRMSAAVMWLGEGRKPLSKAELIDKFGKKGAADILKSPDYENMSEVYAPYTYDDCVKEFGKENADKIKKATECFRTYYDELIDEVNRVRAELYPNNPDKLVAKRKDYFHHFQEMGAGLQGLRNAFNINADIDPLLVGESEYTRPKSKWQGYMQRRLGYKTEYDAVEGFLRYLPAAMHSIHVDPNIVNVRALAYDLASSKADEGGGRGNTNANRFIEYLQSYANYLAGKTTSHIDRFAIQYMGRNFLAVMSWFNNKLKISAVLGNINSVLAQFSNFKNAVGLIENERDFFLGLGDAIASIHPDSPIRRKYKDSGFLLNRFLDKGESKFNTLGENLLPTTWAAKLLGLADEVGTRVTWCAGYREAIRKGLTGDEAILYADDFTRACVAGRGIGEEALLLRSQMAKLFLPFRTEVMNDIRVQQDILFGADADGKKPGKLTRAKNLAELYIASAIINSLIAAAKSDEYDPIEEFSKGYAADGFFAGLRAVFDDYADGIGNPVAFDPIYDIVTGIYQGLSEGETDVEAAGYAFLRSLQNLAGDVVSNNPFSNLLLALLQIEPDTTDAMFNNSVYVAGGAGMPLMGNVAKMIEEFKDGDYGAGLSIIPKSLVPMGTQLDRTVKGLYEYFTGYSTTETAYDRMLGNTGSLKYLIEPGFGNLMRSIFFGTAAWSGTASDFFDEGLWLEDEEVEKVISQDGYDARKDVFDEIVDDKRHARRWGNYEKEAKEIAESIGAEYYAGKEGTPLYEVYASEWGKNQENDAVPFKEFSETIKYSWDDVQYTNNITPELAVVMGSEYGERMKFWFDELNESELFANMDVEDRKEYLDTISGLEFNRVKVEWLHNIKRMPEKEYLEYVDYYNGKVVDAIESLSTWEYDKLEDEVNKKYAIADAYGLDDDVDSYTGWSAVNASGMYMEYYDGTMGRDAYNEIVRYARDASNRKPDSVDQELFRVSRASGSKVNLTGNPYNVLSYSKNSVKYKIDIPTDKVYGLCQEVEGAMRSSIGSLISKPSYKNASAENQVKMIKSNQTSVRSRIKKKYKSMYPSVRVDAILTGGGGASGRVSDLFDEILNMK